MANYKIEREIAVIRDAGANRIVLQIVSWNGQPAKIDLRVWRSSFPEGWLPDKGLLLDEDEAASLCKALGRAIAHQKRARKEEDAAEGAQEAQNAVLIDLMAN